MPKLFGLEPAIIIGVVVSALALLVQFGVPLTDDQQNAIKAFVVSFLPLAGAFWTRTQVIPVAKIEAAHGDQAVKEAAAVTAQDLKDADLIDKP